MDVAFARAKAVPMRVTQVNRELDSQKQRYWMGIENRRSVNSPRREHIFSEKAKRQKLSTIQKKNAAKN